MTTIGWRLVHVTAGNRVFWDHAFGDATLGFTDLVVPHTAADALAAWGESRLSITAWLAAATDDDLAELRPSHLPEREQAAGEVVRTLVDEQVDHGAEIALLRDLWLRKDQIRPA